MAEKFVVEDLLARVAGFDAVDSNGGRYLLKSVGENHFVRAAVSPQSWQIDVYALPYLAIYTQGRIADLPFNAAKECDSFEVALKKAVKIATLVAKQKNRKTVDKITLKHNVPDSDG